MALVASVAQWVEGARPRTLPNAIAPVIAGTGAAAWLDGAVWWKALLALVVAVAMIIGVNYANDYSDGIRGTDDVRAGPLRLVGSPVGHTAFGADGSAGQSRGRGGGGIGAGVVSAPWLIAGRRGVHRRRVAVHRRLETVRLSGAGRGRGVRVLRSGRGARHAVHAGGAGRLGRPRAGRRDGLLSSAVLVANNLRDIPTDKEADKITLAVRLGDARTRLLYQALLAVALALTLVLMLATPWCAVGLIALPLALRAARPVRTGLGGKDLIPVLRDTGLTMLVWSIAVAAALFFG